MVLVHSKRVRWAASVYARDKPELRPRTERILREELVGEEDVILRWIEGKGTFSQGGPGSLQESRSWKREGYTDGSRMGGAAAAATAESAIFLGTIAMVMDAEVLGIAGAWEVGYTVVKSDSQAAIKRCRNLISGAQEVRSWVDERVVKAAEGTEVGLTLQWVMGHSGVEGNERADERVREEVERGVWRSDPSLATSAGIRQTYPLFQKKRYMKWDRDEVRSLTYLHTDKGPVRQWLFKIARRDDGKIYGRTGSSAGR